MTDGCSVPGCPNGAHKHKPFGTMIQLCNQHYKWVERTARYLDEEPEAILDQRLAAARRKGAPHEDQPRVDDCAESPPPPGGSSTLGPITLDDVDEEPEAQGTIYFDSDDESPDDESPDEDEGVFPPPTPQALSLRVNGMLAEQLAHLQTAARIARDLERLRYDLQRL